MPSCSLAARWVGEGGGGGRERLNWAESAQQLAGLPLVLAPWMKRCQVVCRAGTQQGAGQGHTLTRMRRILRSSFHTMLRSLICHPSAHGA